MSHLKSSSVFRPRIGRMHVRLAGARQQRLHGGRHLPQRVSLGSNPQWKHCCERNCTLNRLSGGRAQLKCRENTTIHINYQEQSWICTEGDNCPPNMGGVVMGCPVNPPDVPDNSTGNISPFLNAVTGENASTNTQRRAATTR